MASEAAISCIVPVYNGAAYIEAAIESLVRQSLPPAQIIVVDDGSTDDSAERAIAAGKGLVQIIAQANRGPNAAREAALPLATGDYVHFFDADDLCPAGALRALHEALQSHSDWQAVFGKWRNFWIDELKAEQAALHSSHHEGEQYGLSLAAGLFRSAWLREAGRMASDHLWHATILWLDNLQRSGAAFGRIDVLTLERRIHHHNISRQKSQDDLVDLVLNLHRAARNRKKGPAPIIAGDKLE
jgi:glycosyltransferase involved in cell wall biosynthesis